MSVALMLPNLPLFRRLRRKARDRQDASEFLHVRLPGDMYPHEWVRANKPKGLCYVGPWQVTDMDAKTKYLRSWPVTPGDIGTAYLTEIVAGRKLRRPNGAPVTTPAPLFFTGPRYDHCAYVDIRSCYFELYRLLSLDCRYHPNSDDLGSWYAQGDLFFHDTDELRTSKMVRNSIFGIMRRTDTTIWQNGKWVLRNGATEFYRADLVRCVMDTLQAVAQDCITRFGVHMWLTDAAILPQSRVDELRDYLRLVWHLETSVQASGPSHLLALGRYSVGDKRTLSLDGDPRPLRLDDMPRVDIDYLRQLRHDLWLDFQPNRKRDDNAPTNHRVRISDYFGVEVPAKAFDARPGDRTER